MMGLTWYQITELGNINVLGPVGLIIAIWLLCERRWRLAFDWCVLYGSGLFVVALTKFAFIGWGIGSQALDYTGLSGHAMRATMVMPCLAYLLFYRARPSLKWLFTLLGLLLGGMVAYSRIQVHAHSWADIIGGSLFGLALAAWFLYRVGHAQQFSYNFWLASVSLFGFISMPYAPPTRTHFFMTQLTLQITGHPRPFVREGWRYDPYYCVEPEPGRTTFCNHYP